MGVAKCGFPILDAVVPGVGAVRILCIENRLPVFEIAPIQEIAPRSVFPEEAVNVQEIAEFADHNYLLSFD